MSVSAPDDLVQQALELAASGGGAGEIIDVAAGDRLVVEVARDRVAARVRRRVDDYQATETLRLLNRALSEMPRIDPLDWQVRWEHHRKP